MPEKKQPAPPAYSNVLGGQNLQNALSQGFRDNGVSHNFTGITFECGHTGWADELVHPTAGAIKGCKTCKGGR